MSDDVEKIVVTCPCGAQMRVRAGAVGKTIKCPQCEQSFKVTAPAGHQAETQPAELGLLDDLAVQESAAKPVATAAVSSKQCPQCGAVMLGAAVMCVSCGFNVATGQSASAADVPAKRGMVKSAGTFLLGSALSAGFAAVGGVAWFLAVWFLNVEVGYIAWGIGLLAGLGMHIGHRNPSVKAGVIAAVMSFSSVFLAKAAIFGFLIYAVISGNTDDPELRKTFVAGMLAHEILDERGVESEAERDKQWDSAWEEAANRVEKMTTDEINTKHAEYLAAANEDDADAEPDAQDESEGQATEETADSTGESADDESEAITFSDLAQGFVETQCSLFDLLWVFLAVSSAFRIGSNGFAAKGE
ncbi:hypothetical protein B7486_19195 [cyanobacterium TDX16]|nr:hypothetical protein B7486_19195 [cyanobacterium TDX16]